jgi:hypothetical protein
MELKILTEYRPATRSHFFPHIHLANMLGFLRRNARSLRNVIISHRAHRVARSSTEPITNEGRNTQPAMEPGPSAHMKTTAGLMDHQDESFRTIEKIFNTEYLPKGLPCAEFFWYLRQECTLQESVFDSRDRRTTFDRCNVVFKEKLSRQVFHCVRGSSVGKEAFLRGISGFEWYVNSWTRRR